MTKQEAKNIAQMWCNRTNNLTNYFQDSSNITSKRAKAFHLASVMFARVCKLEIELTQPSKPLNYEVGGISFYNGTTLNIPSSETKGMGKGNAFINPETSEWVAPNWMVKT